ncbi:MAG TPA: PIG-L family deacetylase [bacterium]|nr:PIG-L family deacetylase [bacterium]
MRILIIGAHPDDEVLGAGGTLARLAAQGHQVNALLLCESSSPRYGDSMIPVLKEKARLSADILGIREVIFSDFSNVRTNSIPMLAMHKAITEALDHFKPNWIFTHHRADVHIDHQMVFKATIEATRSFGGSFVEQLLCYEVPSSTEWAPPFPETAFLPNVFYDIASTIGLKTKALSVYKSELREYPHPRSLKAIYKYGLRWGLRIGLESYVEPFEMIRDIR